MHDIKFIREHPEAFDAGLALRGLEAQAALVLALDSDRRSKETKQQEALARRNQRSDAIKQAIIAGDQHRADQLKHEASVAKDVEAAIVAVDQMKASQLDDLLAALPNLPAADVPEGRDEADNVEVSRWGTLRSFDFAPKEHADLAPR